jgi:ParB family chromosome partitioning protein
MAISDNYRRVPCSAIKINREARQRTVIDTSDLEPSIAKYGVLSPIIITDDFTLVAGERRLTTSIKLGLIDIPARFISELDPTELQIIELTENLKRKDLSWQESARAILRIHELFLQEDSSWTITKTAQEIGYSLASTSQYIKVAQQLHDPRVAKVESIRTAANMLARSDDRKAADVLAEIASGVKEIWSGEENVEFEISSSDLGDSLGDIVDRSPSPDRPATIAKSHPESILCEDFLSWAPKYSGLPFNFIHCDFPYGVGVFNGKLSGRDVHETYDDSANTYFSLLECLLVNLDRLMGHSGHLMFWFSMDHYVQTIEMFEDLAPSLLVQRRPLVWMKSDNVGIVPDPKRGPRYIYETALIATREDRPIVKTCANAYAAPTDKRFHHSTKPEPVLRHFFQMFVDESTRMLDPTCGSASALRAAESMNAESVLGLELNPEIAEIARGALRDFRNLRSITK